MKLPISQVKEFDFIVKAVGAVKGLSAMLDCPLELSFIPMRPYASRLLFFPCFFFLFF